MSIRKKSRLNTHNYYGPDTIESAQAKAASLGRAVVFPKPNELFVDIDTPAAMGRFLRGIAYLPSRMLANVSAASRRAALQAVVSHAKHEIHRVRGASDGRAGPVSYRDGRHHALLLQLFANAQLALDEG